MRAIDQVGAVRLLVDLGELDAAVILDGTIEVTDHSRRCRCLIVKSGDRGWVVKQGTNAETRPAVTNEAAMYDQFTRPGIHPNTPRLIHSDPSRGLLVIQFVNGGSLLDGGAAGEKDQRRHVGASMGEAVAAIHSYRGTFDELPAVAPPPILRFDRPTLDVLEYHSGASLELIRIVQARDELNGALSALARQWSPATRTHNDLRSDNIILAAGDGSPVVIDWEMAGLGDPLWDLAAPLAEQLMWWLDDGTAWVGPTSPGSMASGAGRALSHVHAFAFAFLDAYLSGMRKHAPRLAEISITELTKWCAARLVQAAFESTYRSPLVTASTRQLLQLALNMYHRPERAASLFFGIEEMTS